MTDSPRRRASREASSICSKKYSGYSKEQAKEYLLKNLEDDLVHEKAVKVLEYQQRTKDEADTIAREIIRHRYPVAAPQYHTAETTVSVVALPNDEMKGRIIGREGRNVRTLETITGVDLIIDDSPRLSPFRASIRFAARSRV